MKSYQNKNRLEQTKINIIDIIFDTIITYEEFILSFDDLQVYIDVEYYITLTQEDIIRLIKKGIINENNTRNRLSDLEEYSSRFFCDLFNIEKWINIRT